MSTHYPSHVLGTGGLQMGDCRYIVQGKVVASRGCPSGSHQPVSDFCLDMMLSGAGACADHDVRHSGSSGAQHHVQLSWT
jgi:hypothetical protein